MLNTPCPNPACPALTMPAPPRRGRNVYVTCPICKQKARAKFTDCADGSVLVSYSSTSHGRGLSEMVTFRDTPEMVAEYARRGDEWMRKVLRDNL